MATEIESALIFLGTGSSGSVPSMSCLIEPSDPPCSVCTQSLSLPPQSNPNYRCNTSLLIKYYSQTDATHKYILIDAGKTFRESVLRWFVFHRIPRVDSIVLTHDHADATLGLDDIRAVQPFSPTNDIDPTPVYLTQRSMERMEKVFPYLVRKKQKEGQEIRRVAQFCWNIVAEDCNQPFFASGLKLIPLPVMHGEDYICLGFLFGNKDRVAYISDVSRIPASTEYDWITQCSLLPSTGSPVLADMWKGVLGCLTSPTSNSWSVAHFVGKFYLMLIKGVKER
ncbi:putative hydrolase C777.06c isoform X5 [Vigna unguiculata]|uniref:putative hydrolase C777.06c isoform X5 n=1 Tax=Vigna unguiculata TaxID=3917 RepID=UPI0010169880|nr:putative hydrolase C777.06c isoform X5 [Vigna unguiculata]